MNTNFLQLQEQLAQINKLQPQSIKLIAVSKHVSVDNIINAYNHGQTEFAENYAQELISKVTQVQQYPITWHFIGKLQTNKIKSIAPYISWIHSIENTKQILMLNKYRDNNTIKLNVLIEVNLSELKTRDGVNSFDEIILLAKLMQQQKNLTLRGLMGMATASKNNELIRQQFTKLREYKDQLNELGYDLEAGL